MVVRKTKTWAVKGTGLLPCGGQVVSRLRHGEASQRGYARASLDVHCTLMAHLTTTFMKPFVLSPLSAASCCSFGNSSPLPPSTFMAQPEYTPLDREILAHLDALNLEEGMYALGVHRRRNVRIPKDLAPNTWPAWKASLTAC